MRRILWAALYPVMALALGLAIMLGNPHRIEPMLIWWEDLHG